MRRELVWILLFAAGLFTYYNLNSPGLWWDSAVYLGMGKFLWSFGNSGMWESIRPVIWPFFLGVGWKLGLPFLYASLLTLTCYLTSIVLVYLIADKAFGRLQAVIASVLWMVSSYLIPLLQQRMSELPAITLALAGLLLFMNGKYLYSGIMFGLSAMTRFPMAILSAGIILGVWIFGGWKPKIRKLRLRSSIWKTIIFSVGFLLILVPYLVINTVAYDNPILPFTLGNEVAGHDKIADLKRGPSYYFSLLGSETAVMLLALLALGASKRYWMMMPVLILTYLFMLQHKEARFLLMALPFVYIMASEGLVWLSKRKVTIPVLLLFMLGWAFQFSMPPIYEHPQINDLQLFAKEHPDYTYGISSPLQLLYSDAKATLLLYFPHMISSEELESRIKHNGIPDIILLEPGDLPGIENELNIIEKSPDGIILSYES